MKVLRYGLTATLLLSAPTAFALTMTHSANMSSCPLSGEVHGYCVSESEASTFNATSSIDIDCGMFRNGVRTSSRRGSAPAANKVTRFKTTLHTQLLYDSNICVQNRSLYRLSTMFGTPIASGQSGAHECLYIQRPNIEIR